MRPILLIVEAPEIRRGFSATLSQAGYEVVEAESGETALELAPSVLPDLVLIAIVLPEMNGIETAVRLRTVLGSKPSIILMGSLPPLGINDEPLASLVNDYISMDVRTEELLACVNREMRGRVTDTTGKNEV